MWRLNGHAPRVMTLSIIIGTMIIALLTYIIWQDAAHSSLTGIVYDSQVYEPDQTGPFCAGDKLTYTVTVERDRVAPLDIRRHYCHAETGLCLLELTKLDYSTVYDIRPPTSSVRTITIPESERLIPGAWVYVHQVAVANTDNWQTYIVPFTVSDRCDN